MIVTLREKVMNLYSPIFIPKDPVKYLELDNKDGTSKEAILKWLKDVFKIYRFQELIHLL
jgi:hypothetical protein